MRTVIGIAICLLVVSLCELRAADSPRTSESDFLVWADEFNRDGRPDPNNWTYEHGFVRNEELQWYRPENARCENGLLIIEADPNDQPDTRRCQPLPRTPLHPAEPRHRRHQRRRSIWD